jgi:hypothetical protein
MVLIAGGVDNNGNALASAELYQPGSLSPPSLVSIAISPNNPSIPLGSTQRLTAVGTFSDNSTQALASANWSSSDTSITVLSDDATDHGNALGVAQGTATVTACTGGEKRVRNHFIIPTAGTFSATGALNVARYLETATLLNNGQVLMAGGCNEVALSAAELFNPTTGTFTDTGSLNTARDVHGATLLPNGSVLISGGGNSGGATASAELY